MFNPHTYQNSNTAGAAFMEIVQQETDRTGDEPDREFQPIFMPLKQTNLTGTITGPVANLQITHQFGSASNAGGPVLEAVYRFPLPGDAAVTGVDVRFGETLIRAELADRIEAEQRYDDARKTGRRAVLLTRESPDVFSLHVSGIEPGHDVWVVTTFVQSLALDRGGFALRVPLTPAPRYTSMSGRGGRHEHGQPLSLAHDPGHRVRIDLHVIGADSVTCRTHEIEPTASADGLNVTLRDGEVIPDRDLVLNLALPAFGSDPSLAVFHYPDDEMGHDYLLALVHPPDVVDPAQVKPREIILLVDRSGSMSGAKWEAADWAVHKFLSGLRPDDSFSLGLFHSDTRWFSRVAVPATPENVASARGFVDAHDDSGGTHLERALEEAITCGRVSGDQARHIVIITDAQVSNARDNLALARAESQRSTRRRISMLCIDAAPNAWLVHELVAIGGGQANFLTSDPDEGDIATALDDIMRFWDRPIATGLTLTINRPDVWVMGRTVEDIDAGDDESGMIELGDLPAGQPIWVVARTSQSSTPLSLTLADGEGGIIAADQPAARSDSAIKSLFGARRLGALEYQLEPSSWRRGSRSSSTGIREQIVAESLSFGLACSETAFIAVREEAGKLVQRGAIVPNALPAGWSDEFVYQSRAAEPSSEVVYSLDSMAMEELLDPLYGASPKSRFAPEMGSAREEYGGNMTLFSGIPDVTGEEIILYQTDQFGSSGRLTTLSLTITGDDGIFDGDLLLYTGRSDDPRVTVRLRDILNQRGKRPVNIRINGRDPLRLVLRNTVRGDTVPELEITVAWE